MGINKQYDGYHAYDYLPDGTFERFEMCDDLDAYPGYLIPLTTDQEKRAARLAEELIVLSLHEHPTCLPKDLSQVFRYTREGRDVCAYGPLAKSCFDGIFDNMLDGTTLIHSKQGWKWEDILHDLGMRLCDLKHQTMLIQGKQVEDFQLAHDSGKICLVPSVEGSAMIENELDRIDVLFGFGVRMMGIAYSEANALASGIKEDRDGGLTAFGKQAVKRMNQVGMAIDCSHTGYQSSLDVIECSQHPIFLTHVGARSLSDSKRMFPDEVLLACAAKGGVIGVEAAPHTTVSPQNPAHTVDSVFDHFNYLVQLVGIDHVAFGPDTLFGDHVGLHQVFAGPLATASTHSADPMPRVAYVRGMENPVEASFNLIRGMIKHGYSDQDIAKAAGQNIIRVLQEVWPK